jgi:hypothetical protein
VLLLLLLVHGVLEVEIYFFTFLSDQRPPLRDHIYCLPLLSSYCNLEFLLVSADLVNLFLQVNDQALHDIHQLVLTFNLLHKYALLLPQVIIVLMEDANLSLDSVYVLDYVLIPSICLLSNKLTQALDVVLDLAARIFDYLHLLLSLKNLFLEVLNLHKEESFLQELCLNDFILIRDGLTIFFETFPDDLRFTFNVAESELTLLRI